MKRLIIVLGGLAVLVYAASAGMQWLTPRVEEDLANRVNVSLAEQGLLWADVSVDGRKVTLSGNAPSAESRDKALTAAARVFGVERVTDGLMLAEDVTATTKVASKKKADSTYTVTIKKEGDDISLAGTVPDQQSLDVLTRLAVTHYGAEHVSNSLVVKAANAPAGWRSATGTVLFNMTNLEEAEATLSGNEIMISGTVVDKMFSDQISAQLDNTLPENYKLALAVDVVTPTAPETDVVAVETPIVTVSTTKDAAKEIAEDTKLAAINPAAGTELKVAEKIEPKAESSKTVAVTEAKKADVKEEPKVTAAKAENASPSELLAVDTASATGILAKVEAFMSGNKMNLTDIVPSDAEKKPANTTCKTDELAVHKIYFGFDKTDIKDVYKPTIATVAALVPACDAVEIAGYTDSTGSPLYNQWLSEQRAQSGMRALIRAGASKAKLVAKGYGISQPIAANSTKTGRSQNRRIEFRATDVSALTAVSSSAVVPAKTEPKAETKVDTKIADLKKETVQAAAKTKAEAKKVIADAKVENPKTVPNMTLVNHQSITKATVVETVSATVEQPWWERFQVTPVSASVVTTTDVTITSK